MFVTKCDTAPGVIMQQLDGEATPACSLQKNQAELLHVSGEKHVGSLSTHQHHLSDVSVTDTQTLTDLLLLLRAAVHDVHLSDLSVSRFHTTALLCSSHTASLML